MKRMLSLPRSLMFLTIGLAACSTPADRISRNRSVFEALPAAVQEKVRAGQVEIGFRPEVVLLALGEPDRRVTRTAANGLSEVWTYRQHGPSFSFGFGIAGGSRSSAVGAGVTTNNYAESTGDRLRVIFQDGVVAAIETARRP